MEHHAADKLNGVGAHSQHPVGRLPNGGEGFRQKLVQGLPLLQPIFEFGGFGLQGFLGKRPVFLLQPQDFIHRGLDFLDLPLGTGAENFVKYSHMFLLLRLPRDWEPLEKSSSAGGESFAPSVQF